MEFFELLLTVAPLLAGLELIVGLMLMIGHVPPVSVDGGLSAPQFRRLGAGLATAAILWGGMTFASGDLLGDEMAATVNGLAAFAPWVGILAVSVAFTLLWCRGRRPAPPALLRALNDPAKRAGIDPEMVRFVGRIRALARRFTGVGTLTFVIRAAFLGAVVALGFLLVDRILIATGIADPVGLAAPFALAVIGGLVAGLLLAYTTPTQAAIRADLRLGLRERIATALSIEGENAFENAVRRDAVLHLERASMAGVVPFRWPWQGTATLAVGAALVVATMFLPAIRLLTPEQTPGGPTAVNSDVGTAIKVLTSNRREMTDLAEEYGTDETKELMREVNRIVEDLEARPSPESMTDEEKMKKMAELSDLEDRAKAMRDQLNQLRQDSQAMKQQQQQNGADQPTGDSPVDQMKNSMADGNFEDAAKALDDLKDQIEQAEKEGNSEKMDELKKKFEEDAQKLEDMAKQFGNQNPLKAPMLDMADMMKNMSPEDAQKLKDALQNMQNQMNDFGNQGKCDANQQMLDMLQDQLSNARFHFGNPPKSDKNNGKPNQPPTDFYITPPDQLGKQQADQLMQLQADCQNGMCNGGQPGNQPGNSGSTGNGMGSPGNQAGNNGGTGNQGQGGSQPGESDVADMDRVPWLQRGQLQRGDIIASMRTMGLPPAGEAQTAFRQSYEQARREAEDSINRQAIPPEYRPLARRYFDAIHPRGDTGGSGE